MSTVLVSIDDLVTVDEIAKRLRISVNCATNIVTDRDSKYRIKFPKPLVGCAKRGVWLWQDIEYWIECVEYSAQKRSRRESGSPQRQPGLSAGAHKASTSARSA